MTQYGRVVDRTKWKGCMSCVIACRDENATPTAVWWNTLHTREVGSYPTTNIVNMPLACMQCSNPACVAVCPTKASYQREDGIVLVDQSKCIGCRYCIQACPYGARRLITDLTPYYPDPVTGLPPAIEQLTPFEQFVRSDLVSQVNPHAKHVVGTVEKCTFCEQRLSQGKEPACVQNCPMSARIFGDISDPNSQISQEIAQTHAQPLSPEVGTNPKVYYRW